MDKIQCPNCGHIFELSDALIFDLENELKKKFDEQSKALEISAAEDKKKLKEELLKEKQDFIEDIEQKTTERLEEEFKLKANLTEEQLQTVNEKYLRSQEKIQKLLLETSYNNQALEEERTRLLEEHNKSKNELFLSKYNYRRFC